MKNIKKISISLLAVLCIPAALIYTDYAISNQPETVSVKEELVLPKVTTQPLESGINTSIIEHYGEVIPAEKLLLLGQVSGQIVWKSANFKVGKRVKKGTLLLRIEDASYQAALATAEKSLADAHLSLLQEQRKYKRAQKNWKRSEIADKPSQLALRIPQLTIAKSQYNAAQRAVKNAEKDLADTKIYAPFDAVITSRNVTTGSYISIGASIGELKSSEAAEIKIALTQSEWQQLPVNLDALQVNVFSPDTPNHVWIGRVSELSLVIDQDTRTRQLTIVIDSPLDQKRPLLFGSFLNIHLHGKVHTNSYLISSSSITADGYIWLEKDNQLIRHKAKTLFRDTHRVGIAQETLAKHINLVIKPMAHYTNGMKVIAMEAHNDEQ